MAEIVLDRVTKSYPDGAMAVQELSLTIAEGEFIILVGPSGCGKSTTLNMIAGLEDISSGELRIGGERVNEKAPKDRDIAMVFQSYALYPHMTVRQNIAFPLTLAKLKKAEIAQKVAAADIDAPDLGANRATTGFNFDHHRFPIFANGQFHGELADVGLQVLFPLPTVLIQALQEVALPVEQADADEGNAQVGCTLDVVSGEHAQAAGINRQRFVQTELRGKIGNRVGPEHPGIHGAPGAVCPQVLLLAAVDIVDAAMQTEFGGAAFDFSHGHLVEQRDGILIQLPPAGGIEVAKQTDRLVVPTPAEITGN